MTVTASWDHERRETATVDSRGAFVLRGLPVDIDIALEASTDGADHSAPPLEGATTLPAGRATGHVSVRLAPRISHLAGFGWNCESAPDAVQECKRSSCDTCTHQDAAWSAIYYVDDYETWSAKTGATAQDCEQLQTALATTSGVSHVGACKRVGDVLGPASALDRSLLEPGDTWYCPRDGSDTCSRSHTDCNRQSGSECDGVDAAFVTTAPSGFAKQGASAHIYRTATACVTGRRAFDADIFTMSACTRIGPVARAAVNRSIVPRGTGWYCYSRGAYGWCWRDRGPCEESQAQETAASTTCRFVEHAYVTQYAGEETDVFPTLAACQAWLDDFPKSTRCERM